MYTLKKGVMVLAVVFIMLLSGFFGRSLMYVMAEEEADTRPENYTSIHLKDGDTLWSIAQTYCADSEESVEEYVRELRQMNSLSDDHIDAGHYLTIRYYK